jgi:serine/threonine-protein kinase
MVSWRRIDAILDEALDLTDPARAQFLDRACGDDTALRQRVEALLQADARTDGLLDSALDEVAASLLQDEADIGTLPPGTPVRQYRIVREIGVGGMGRVYLADRADGQFDQRVALKIIRKGLSWGELRERFLQERQILAGLHHPNLARLLDGGVTDDGRPYFAMEYVEGRPITDYATAESLTTRTRLELFTAVCAAVSYAQQRLVVHRDLKPSNILVTAEGEVKLLDFGIARLLGTTEDDFITRVGPQVLTPEYAAPEQLHGGTITTATDVYALGRVLLELLMDPLPGSADPTGKRALPRDLAIIADKAMAADPGQRYASAAELGEDIRRYLAGLPILGRPPSLAYRTHRFIARNKLGVVAAAALLLSLVAGLVLTTWQAERAEREAVRANRVTEFLVSLFSEADPDLQAGREVTATEVLARGAGRIETELDADPGLQAELYDVVGQIQTKRGAYADAQTLHERALELRERLYGGDHPLVAESLSGLGEALLWQSDYQSADTVFTRALEIERRRRPLEAAKLARAATNQASVAGRLGRYEEQERLSREALELDRTVYGPGSLEVAKDLANLAVILSAQGRYDESESLQFEALETLRAVLPAQHSEIALALHNLGHLYYEQRRFEPAEDYLRQAVEMRRFLYQGPHPRLAASLRVLGMVVQGQERIDEAAPLFEQALETSRAYFGNVHTDVASTLNDIAINAFMRGDLPAARENFAEALDIFRQLLPPGHSTLLTLRGNLGRIALELGDLDEAEAAYVEVLAGRREQLGEMHPMVAQDWIAVGTVHLKRERWIEAEDMIRRGLAIYRETDGDDSVNAGAAKSWLGIALGEQQRSEEAERVLREALAVFEAQLPAGHSRIVNASLALGRVIDRAGRHEEALPLLEFAEVSRREAYGDRDGRTGEAIAARGVCLLALGRTDEGTAALQEALLVLTAARGPEDLDARRVELALRDLPSG